MFPDLSVSLFMAADSVSSQKGQPKLDNWVSSSIPDLGGSCPGHQLGRDFLLLATERQMLAWRESVWSFLAEHSFPFQDIAHWTYHKKSFDSIYNQFFERETSDPALVWTTPIWFNSDYCLAQTDLIPRYSYNRAAPVDLSRRI